MKPGLKFAHILLRQATFYKREIDILWYCSMNRKILVNKCYVWMFNEQTPVKTSRNVHSTEVKKRYIWNWNKQDTNRSNGIKYLNVFGANQKVFLLFYHAVILSIFWYGISAWFGNLRVHLKAQIARLTESHVKQYPTLQALFEETAIKQAQNNYFRSHSCPSLWVPASSLGKTIQGSSV